MAGTLNIKRVYLKEEPEDGKRILVDALWPRGESKVKADLSEWDKAIAPDAADRKALHHGQESFEDFKANYLKKLASLPEAKAFLEEVRKDLKEGNVTLVYGSKDEEHNNAVVLLEWLKAHLAADSSDESDGKR